MIIIKFKGGLGNQLFQYNFFVNYLLEREGHKIIDLRAFAKNNLHHRNFLIDKIIIDFYNRVENKKVLILKKNNIFVSLFLKIIIFIFRIKLYKNDDIGYDNNMIEIISTKKNFSLDAYFISILYLSSKSQMSFSNDFFNFKYNQIKNSNSVGIHVRLGDYLENSLYSNIANKDYLEKSITYMKKEIRNPVFFVFTNDSNAAKKLLNNHPNLVYIENSEFEFDELYDFKMLMLCKNKILSNSTFSWWAAIQGNNDGIIIAPKKFINKVHNINEIVDPNWILI